MGSYTWYWGFEVFNSDPTRYTADGNNPPRRGEGVQLVGRRDADDQHDRPRHVPGRAHGRRRHRCPDLRQPLLLQRLRRTRPGPRPRHLRPEPRLDAQAHLRQHHLPAVRLGHPRLRRGRSPGQPRLPGQRLLQQRRPLRRLAHQHPRGGHAEQGHEPKAHLQLHLQHRPGQQQQPRLQRRLHEPQHHQQLLRQRHGPRHHQLQLADDHGQHVLRLDLGLLVSPGSPATPTTARRARPASRSSSAPMPTRPSAPTSSSTTGRSRARSAWTSAASWPSATASRSATRRTSSAPRSSPGPTAAARSRSP